MDVLQINKNDVNDLRNYILNRDISEFLKFYELKDKSKYFDMLINYIFNQESISLIGKKDNVIVGILLGKIKYDTILKDNVAIVEYVHYDNLADYELMLNKFQQIAKEKSCGYVNVCIPEFQREALNILNSTGFVNYKVKLEKELL